MNEPRALSWMLGVLAPLVLLGVGYRQLDTVVDLPPLMPLATALGAGACYGVMRRRRALPGAGRWLPATLILSALLVPEYCWLRWANPTDSVPGQLVRNTIAWALALTTVAVLAVAVLAIRQSRARANHTHSSGDPAGLDDRRLWPLKSRHRPLGASTFKRPSVNINPNHARVPPAVKHGRGITTTETIRRASGLLGLLERVGRAPVGAERAPVEQPASDYVEAVASRLRAALPGLDAGLTPLYTLLVLVKGTATTLGDVHDAREVWQWVTDPEHTSLVPHDQLPDNASQRDRPVLHAIHLAAGPGQSQDAGSP